MPLSAALEVARKRNFDLVEVAPTAEPPVCRLLDYGKYKYEQDKKERELRRSQRVLFLREVQIRPKIGEHDFEAKTRSVKKLLDDGNKVKVSLIFKGREITHPEIGYRILKRMAELMQGKASIDKEPAMDGKRIIMILSPVTVQKIKKAGESKDAENQNS